jgi:hypothetical protein
MVVQFYYGASEVGAATGKFGLGTGEALALDVELGEQGD